MQPCAVCGGVQVDAAGYCTQCRTFRGVPQPPPGYPQAPPPAYTGYPQPGSPPAYPTSVPPAGYPTSVPPSYAQQTSGGGYPGYPQQQPQRGRSFLVPLVALASTLVVLVVAIVIVAAVRGGDEEPVGSPTTSAPTSAGPGESQSAAPAGDIDQCVIGTWQVTSHREDVPVEGVGKVTFIGGEGATLQLNADGTGETDYRSGTEFQGTTGGRTYKLEVSGKLTFEYTARSGSAEFTDVNSNASGKLFIDGEQYGGSIPFNAEADTSTYTCSTGLLTQKTFLYTTEYERVS
ncbi:hypothetical protein [Phytohabitans houttuyneae]|uniref:Uncharacterized protein n=1 Tax=Phytohabitans houttuyneae TaxID=1076126 RepID=A0A6V8KGR2_9ACTN|nr:hypothetical protein [Phytohabitans houttuyneae]GFJ79905.1 hypothetical protein Phou_040850 [Phytohabitans houttuyneae]